MGGGGGKARVKGVKVGRVGNIEELFFFLRIKVIAGFCLGCLHNGDVGGCIKG